MEEFIIALCGHTEIHAFTNIYIIYKYINSCFFIYWISCSLTYLHIYKMYSSEMFVTPLPPIMIRLDKWEENMKS